MAELKIPDHLFGNAEQPEIDAFMNTLASACSGSWEPTSEGYRITGLDDLTVANLEDCVADMIDAEIDTGKEQ